MDNKLLSAFVIIIMVVGIFTLFATVVYAKGVNLFGSDKNHTIITLKDDADINKSKGVISKIPGVRVLKVQDRNKEWSKMVNKMDLPKMENPFKNEFTIKISKKDNINEVLNKIKELDFVENVSVLGDESPKK